MQHPHPCPAAGLQPHVPFRQLGEELIGWGNQGWPLADSPFGSAIFLNKFSALAAVLTLWQCSMISCVSNYNPPPRPQLLLVFLLPLLYFRLVF